MTEVIWAVGILPKLVLGDLSMDLAGGCDYNFPWRRHGEHRASTLTCLPPLRGATPT